MKVRVVCVALVGVLSLLGCAEETESPETSTGSESTTAPQEDSGIANSDTEEEEPVPTGESLRFATYNAGIAAQFVSYAEERIAPIAEALGSVDADVLCLQEAWSPESIEAFIESTKDTFPHSFYEMSEEDVSGLEPACTEEDVADLQACVDEFCADTDNLADCGTANCITEFTALPPACQGCVASNLGLGIEGVISACVVGGGSLSYGGHNGLLVLSKVELRKPSLTLLPSFLVQRAWIEAEVGGFHMACTHLATPLTPEYAGEFESYVGEQAAQAGLVLEALAEVSGPTVLLGDTNNGPAVGALSADILENWELFGAAGFTDPNVESDDPFCTWCPDNTLSESTSGYAIDHVLVRGATGSDVARFLDGTTEITVGEETLTTSYSDHYGVAATVTAPAE